MTRHALGVAILITFFLPTYYEAWAGYSGPLEIFSGPLDERHYTDEDGLGKSLSLKFYILSDGTYVEWDAQDNINIYGPSGLIKQFTVSPGPGLEVFVNFFERYIYVEERGNVYIYDYAGTLKSTMKKGTYVGDFDSALPSGDIITNLTKITPWAGYPPGTSRTDNYYRYSITGQLLKTYTSKPLELGVAKSQILGSRKYKTTITFDDRTYSILMDWDYDKSDKNDSILRDERNNIYLLTVGSVSKYSTCGKLLGQVKMPSDVVFREKNVTGREPEYIQHDLYGKPQMDIHGNVYTWKQTPNNYYILKWTWVDAPVSNDEDMSSQCIDEKLLSIIVGFFQHKTYEGDKRIYSNDDITLWCEQALGNMKGGRKMFLKALRNEIYARHGRPFESTELKQIFYGFTWYVPRRQFIESELNTIEKQNVEIIDQYEKKSGWAR